MSSCPACAAGVAPGQRYCLACGERCTPLPDDVAAMLGVAPADEPLPPPPLPRRDTPVLGAPAAAVAVMAILAFGVVVGSVVSPPAESAPTPAIVAVSPPVPAPAAPVEAPAAPAPAPAAPTPAAPQQQTVTQTTPAPAPAAPAPVPAAPTGLQLPAVKHVFMIVLSGHGYDAAFGPDSQAPYLAGTLTKQGELLTNYYGVTGGDLANEIALVSGQGPNPDTASGCQTRSELTPGTPSTDPQQKGQTIGSGCVFPRTTLTLADELVANGSTWKAYVEPPSPAPDAPAPDPSAPPPACGDPANGDPFAYFHSIVDLESCSQTITGLDQLTTDLTSADQTPSLSYIVPNACHDGAEQPCAPDQPAGLAAADAFLKDLVPRITDSPAYKDGGMIAITFAAAPQDGPDADSSACCAEPAYPNMPPAAPAPPDPATPAKPLPPGADAATGGGGRVGLLLVIFSLARTGRATNAPAAVGAYIGAAYWFTSSTSFANPAISVGRMFSDSFAGIAPASVPGFVLAQLAGGLIALGVIRTLYPDVTPADAADVVVPHDGAPRPIAAR